MAGYPMDFNNVSAAAQDAAKLNSMLKTLEKHNEFSIHVDGHQSLKFGASTQYGYQGALRKTIEEWMKQQIALCVATIERELAKRD